MMLHKTQLRTHSKKTCRYSHFIYFLKIKYEVRRNLNSVLPSAGEMTTILKLHTHTSKHNKKPFLSSTLLVIGAVM